MLFLELVLLAYAIVAILAVVVAVVAIENKGVRTVFIVLGIVMPAIFLYAAVASLFSRKPMLRYNEEMARVEDEIETERIRIFGGERTHPSFGERWKSTYTAYLNNVSYKAATASERIACFGRGLHHGHLAP